MSEQNSDSLEARMRETAAQFAYPPTPDVAGAVQRRLAAGRGRELPGGQAMLLGRLAWLLAAILLLLGVLLAVPQVRAAVLEFLQIGAMRIFLNQPAPEFVSPEGTASTGVPVTSQPSFLDLTGETTLEAAQERLGVPLRLPAYPDDLGPPDKVYLQENGGPSAILVWLEPGSSDRARASLHVLIEGQGNYGAKFAVESQEQTSVNGQPAYWVSGRHFLQYFDASGNAVYEASRLVEGNVLIWSEGAVTFRLETDMSLEEAILTAESLQ
jgi:hypothetical protein